ncbi:hypothetical protein MCU_00749 [Bartonella elizabethae Re6043vi]|uniref:Uncharacterized protein n=2 Tax=Bartonella elizabethae TaxID=807 RepID=J1A4P0_BAREL|nr:hypothetical protein MCU_00749 [Bartonella elizabethae Re6043vi]EJF96678.1 hypothetical protein MEE_00577 [Bartonella elizabethae F9251 = ATCC 49927]VEJ40114.1 Uncharacterised protein [Bartonella elizabethae]
MTVLIGKKYLLTETFVSLAIIFSSVKEKFNEMNNSCYR